MSAAERLLGKEIRWVTDYEPELSGKVFVVSKVHDDTSGGADVQGLPFFTIKDKEGREYSAFEYELRTADGSPTVPEGEDTSHLIGEGSILDIDPDVNAVAEEVFQKYKDVFDQIGPTKFIGAK